MWTACQSYEVKCLWSDPLLCGSAWFQMGSYFGSSLCAVDLNQDGLSDLLVGAPMHSQLRDEGQVSVYLSKGNVSGSEGERGTWTRRFILRDTLSRRFIFTDVRFPPSLSFTYSPCLCRRCYCLAVLILSSAWIWFLSTRVCYPEGRIKQWSSMRFSSGIM